MNPHLKDLVAAMATLKTSMQVADTYLTEHEDRDQADSLLEILNVDIEKARMQFRYRLLTKGLIAGNVEELPGDEVAIGCGAATEILIPAPMGNHNTEQKDQTP